MLLKKRLHIEPNSTLFKGMHTHMLCGVHELLWGCGRGVINVSCECVCVCVCVRLVLCAWEDTVCFLQVQYYTSGVILLDDYAIRLLKIN